MENIPKEWICDYSPNQKHYFMNSWGSLRNGGYCGVCKWCNINTCTPYTAREAMENNYADIDLVLKEQLEYHSNPKNYKPFRRY